MFKNRAWLSYWWKDICSFPSKGTSEQINRIRQKLIWTAPCPDVTHCLSLPDSWSGHKADVPDLLPLSLWQVGQDAACVAHVIAGMQQWLPRLTEATSSLPHCVQHLEYQDSPGQSQQWQVLGKTSLSQVATQIPVNSHPTRAANKGLPCGLTKLAFMKRLCDFSNKNRPGWFNNPEIEKLINHKCRDPGLDAPPIPPKQLYRHPK